MVPSLPLLSCESPMSVKKTLIEKNGYRQNTRMALGRGSVANCRKTRRQVLNFSANQSEGKQKVEKNPKTEEIFPASASGFADSVVVRKGETREATYFFYNEFKKVK